MVKSHATEPLPAWICCADCGGVLRREGTQWQCTGFECDASWHVDLDGVASPADGVHFGPDDFRWDRLLDEIREVATGDVDAVQRLLDDVHDSGPQVPSADWTMLGDFFDRKVVDVSCGYESPVMTLASIAAEVVSANCSLAPTRLLAQVSRIRRLENLTAVHADVTRLPIGRSSVDRITMFGVIEKAGCIDRSAPPHEIQVRLLSYLRTMLSTDGELWLGVDNRLSPRHIAGRPGRGVPFTSVLPWQAANSLTKLARGEENRLRLASESGYRRMLAEAGFGEVEVFYAFNDYSSPRFIASSASGSMIRHYVQAVRQGGGRRSQLGLGLLSLADRCGIADTICPSFVIRAARE